VLFLTLTHDGRLRDEALIPRLLEAGRSATDCFVLCHGWPYDDDEARAEAGRFFGLLDQAMTPLRNRVAPLRVALRWPATPIPDQKGESPNAPRVVPAGFSGALARQVIETEVAEGPEDEAELEVLRRQLQAGGATTTLSPRGRTAGPVADEAARGQVGARFVRESRGRHRRLQWPWSAAGYFTWTEWATALGAQLQGAVKRGEPDDGSRYFEHWLTALEHLVTEKKLTDLTALDERKGAWADAYRRTPHGQPVEL